MTRPPRRKQQMDKTSKTLVIALAAVGVLLAFLAGRAVYNLVKGWSLTALPGAPVDTNPVTGLSGKTGVDLNIASSEGPEALAWDGKSRVNILLLGLDASDQRELTEPGPRMSDTMILVTIDPLSQTLGALSIRRDLWVNIPGYDYHKINKAHFIGEAFQLPGGGAGLAVKTVEEFLGVPIHFYAKVDFNTFVKVVDEIDGVKLDINERILADWNGDGNNYWIEPGTYTLPGTAALAYARYRSDETDGDIGRGARQMQVITAIRDRILDFNMLPTLVKRAPAIYKEVSKGVQTNMNFDQAVQIMVLMTQIPRENLHTFNITYTHAEPTMVTTYEEGTQYILRPFPEKIRELRDQIFAAEGAAAAPIVLETEDPLALALAENARVSIFNGTNTNNLAEDTEVYLGGQGLNVVEIGSASETYLYTTLVVHNATPYTLAFLSSVMQVPTTRIFNKYDPNANTDITVFLGNNWATENPMQ